MPGREKRVLLREYLSRGVSKSALAEQVGDWSSHDPPLDCIRPAGS